MFGYTGGFSIYALGGGAELVHSVDSSGKAIDLTREHVEMNFPGDHRHEAFAVDAFSYFREIKDPYDLIILDPPAFAKHQNVLNNALQGYKRLNQRAFEADCPGRDPVYLQLFTGGKQGEFPKIGICGSSQCQAKGADSAPTFTTTRSSGQYLPSRRRIPEGTGSGSGVTFWNFMRLY